MSSAPRPSTILLFCSLAAGVGAASGSLVDASPLRWGGELRDYISQGEHPAVVARRMHDTFENAKRPLFVEAEDYLAQDDVIYLEPIEESVGVKRKLPVHDRPPAAVDTPSTESIELAANAELRQNRVYEEPPSAADSEHRIAEDIAGVKVIDFPGENENGRQSTRADWRSVAAVQPDRSAKTDPTG